MGQYEVRHQCDPKMCVDCDNFYFDREHGDYACELGHDDLVDRFRHAEDCEDFKER